MGCPNPLPDHAGPDIGALIPYNRPLRAHAFFLRIPDLGRDA
jgi:hypothetical protein